MSQQRRDLRVDAVRGVALVLMYLAHCAPTLGPGRVLQLADYATYPLFALLVGVGAELGRAGARERWWVGPLVRGAVLVALAELLEGLHVQVYVVLAFLGALTWIVAPLARVGSVPVGVVGLAALVVAPWLDHSGPYQLTSMVWWGALGILLARHLLTAGRRQLATGTCCALVATAGFAVGRSASGFRPYAVTHVVLVFDAVLIVAITLLVVALSGRRPLTTRPLAAMGAMSLSLYVLQLVWLDADGRFLDHASDDTWLNVGVLVVGSLTIALLWPWRRGPLEGPVAALTNRLEQRSTRV